jgi:hypothetical protein
VAHDVNGNDKKKKEQQNKPVASLQERLGITMGIMKNSPIAKPPSPQMGLPTMPAIANMADQAMLARKQNSELPGGAPTPGGNFMIEKQKNKVARMGRGLKKEEIF